MLSSLSISSVVPPRALHSSLHDALPIYRRNSGHGSPPRLYGQHEFRSAAGIRLGGQPVGETATRTGREDRKSTRLNSSHLVISYAVFCLKKKTSLITILTSMIVCKSDHH